MDKLLVLFRYIEGKDVFEAYYKKDLAKRLLLNKSASVDAEKLMLQKLKSECGASFTTKLEAMFKDVELSKDLNGAYREYVQGQSRLYKIEHNVNVLTTGQWPTYKVNELIIPDSMKECRQLFEGFYFKKHTGRRLSWLASLGTCTLEAKFDSAAKSLLVSEHQALVLMLFNDVTELDPEYIHNATKLNEEDVKMTIISLLQPKTKMLEPVDKTETDVMCNKFCFNSAFTSRHYRIKINVLQAKETMEEKEVTEERIALDRQYMIDAAVVRIMKARKELSHQQLIGEVFEQVKFKLKALDVKRRIESLIGRDYLERDSEDQQLYKYVA